MTRINTVPVETLSAKHLLAEYKEISRPFNKVIKRIQKNNLKMDIAPHYILNRGHETFFFDKLQWLFFRYHQLRDELLKRGFNINLDKFDMITRRIFNKLSDTPFWGWYEPTPMDHYLNMARLVNNTKDFPLVEEEKNK